MTASRVYPCNANGERGAWQHGGCFAPWQAEWHKLEGRHASIHAQFGIVELADGTWLSDLEATGDRHPTRTDALRAAVERVIARARHMATPFRNGGVTFSPHITVNEANAIIAWAGGKLGAEPEPMTDAGLPRRAPAWADLPLFRGRLA